MKILRSVALVGAVLTVVAVGTSSNAVCAEAVLDPIASRGWTPSLVYDGDAAANLAGGSRRGATYSGNLHLQLLVDGERMFNSPGTTVFLNGLWIHGGQPSSLVGDLQGVSSIAAPADVNLEEAWLQHNFLGNRFSLLAGLYDLNSEFYRLNSAGLFLNGSFGIGPELSQSGVSGPSIFPNTSLGARFGYKADPDLVLRMAILDGVPFERPDGRRGAFRKGDGLLLVSEVAILFRPVDGNRPTSRRFRIGRSSGLAPYEDKLAIGTWYYTATFDDLSRSDTNGRPVRHAGSAGAYVLGDHLLVESRQNSGQRLAGFIQLGAGDARVNPVASYAGGGLVATGFVPQRPRDELGMAFAAARTGKHLRELHEQQGMSSRVSEVAIEATYLAPVNAWLTVQPDVQYVIHPGAAASTTNAWVFQLRFEVAL